MTPRRDMAPELARALRDRAQGMLPEVLDAAAARARERLIEQLADALVDEALANTNLSHRGTEPDESGSRAAATDPAAHPKPTDQDDFEARGESGLYAYAITNAEMALPEDLTPVGESGRGITTVSDGGLALIVSEIDAAELDGLAEDEVSEESRLATLARCHDAVVRAGCERGPVLPLRFGTVLAGRDAACRLLREQHEQATDLLTEVDGHQEWGLRLRPDPAGEPEAADPAGADRSSGAAYLASRGRQRDAAERHRRQQRDAVAALCERLTVHATSTVERGARGGALVELALLVSHSGEAAFLAEADRLAADAASERLVLDVTGPWPPYSFANLEWDTADA